ncbi:MAG: hypothetical protein JOZ57_03380 [Abitibacteriaceae bacterium]|nr:hypothetical protein [Abditibacteriaceae bacterium]
MHRRIPGCRVTAVVPPGLLPGLEEVTLRTRLIVGLNGKGKPILSPSTPDGGGSSSATWNSTGKRELIC